MSNVTSLWQQRSLLGPDNRTASEALLPDLARTYWHHSTAGSATLATAVRLEMTGEIKLKRWMPFTATQVVRTGVGFVWCAMVKKGFTFITGSDEFIDGQGNMKWKLFGLFPVMVGSGPDITRSAGDRFAMERILLPSSFGNFGTTWIQDHNDLTVSTVGLSSIHLNVSPTGAIRTVSMLRWGNANESAFGLTPFGGFIDEESTWCGYTIPSRLRIGWYFGSDRFAEEGEFFRATITHAEFK